jgi:hypothetical protein
MREVKFDKAKVWQIAKSLSDPRNVELKIGTVGYSEDNLLMIAGVCIALACLSESVVAEMNRAKHRTEIHKEHKEMEYRQRATDANAAVAFIANTAFMALFQEDSFDLYCEPVLRAKVEAHTFPFYDAVPIQGFYDRPDSPWYPLPDEQNGSPEEQDEQP